MKIRLARRLVRCLQAACAAPPLIIALLAWRYAAGYAQLDNQRFAWMAEGVLRGMAPLSTLFNPVNAHRQPVVILMLDALGRLSHWDFHWFSAVSFVFAVGSYLILLNVIWRTVPGRVARWSCAAVGSLLVFSTVRASVWQMSWGVIWPFMDSFVFAALAIAVSRIGWRWKNAAGAVLCVVGMWVLLQGLLLWFVVPAALAAARLRARNGLGWRWACAWLLGGFLGWAVYFHFGVGRFQTWGDAEASMPSLFSDVAGNAVAFCRYFLGVAGMFSAAAPPTPGGLSASALVPGLFAAGALVCAIPVMICNRKTALAVAPWFVLAFFSLASVGLIAVGRFRIQDLAYGFEGEGSDHYAFSSLLLVLGLWIALIQARRWIRAPGSGWLNIAALASAAGLLVLSAQGFVAGVEKFPRYQSGILADKAQFYFCRITGEYDANRNFKEIPERLSEIGFYNPSLFTARTLADEIHRANAAPACGAITNAAVGDPEGSLSIEGWSWMPPGIRRPDQVFLVTDEAAPRVLGFSGPAGHSADAVDYRNRTGRKAGGWNIFIKKASLPLGTTVLHAYVLDANQRTAFRVGGALGLTVEQDRTPSVRVLPP